MAAGTGKSRTFHFAYTSRAGKYSALVAIPVALIAFVGFFSIALVLAGLLLAVAVITGVVRWFVGRPARPAREVREARVSRVSHASSDLPRLDGPQGPSH